MIYLLAWFSIGFVSAVLANTYYTREQYNNEVLNFLKKKGLDSDAPSYTAAKIINIVMGTLFGIFTISAFYDKRKKYWNENKK